MKLYEELVARGLIAQSTNEEKIKRLLDDEKVTFYIGFDPTADSLHLGHFLQMVIMAHMQKAGHRPIALFGGGTGLVGDPTGKTDMRKMLTKETIDHNVRCFQKQMSTLIDFSDGKALMVDNGDWLRNLNYIDFLRDVGVHFSVNRMLTAECFKSRLEKGLSFIEFNYMLMQSYDFLHLNREYGAVLELGGDDQWSNIINGVDLVRKSDGREVYGMTFKLLTTSAGVKMGKTVGGALWLDPKKTSPYEFFQYMRNVDDSDVINTMKMITFVPLEEIAEYEKLEGAELNKAKERLAYEVCKMVHGEEEAKKALDASRQIFAAGASSEHMPTTEVGEDIFTDGEITITDLMLAVKLIPSKGEGRRLIEQGGVSVNGEKITSPLQKFSADNIKNEEFIIKKGKKVFHKVTIK